MLEDMKDTRVVGRNRLERDGEGLVPVVALKPDQLRTVF
jgi:hypothetical protein